MTTISADQVKELRERTGSGMMECKRALVEAQGDIELALENLRKKGAAQADKKGSNIAAEGIVVICSTPDNKKAVMVEINCQTDFVARDESFKKFANDVALSSLKKEQTDINTIASLPIADNSQETVEERRRELISKLGENIQLRRAVLITSDGTIGTYLHSDRIGVLVQLSTENKELGKDLAMHIAATRPKAISAADIPTEWIDKEREIYTAQALESGKPAEIIAKVVEGRLKKHLSDETLLGQAFVKDPSITIEKLVADAKTKVISMTRFEVGEGIERKVENFADEVMAQVHGSK